MEFFELLESGEKKEKDEVYFLGKILMKVWNRNVYFSKG